MDFSEKAFVVMGAASGIGSELCHMLAKNNASLFMTGRDIEKLEALRSSVMYPERHVCFVVNITEDSFQTMQKELATFMLERKLKGINGGVYCPGVFPFLPLRALDICSIQEIMQINYTGAILMTKLLARKEYRPACGSSIVMITSVSGRKGQKGYALYGGSKAALAASCRALALELVPMNVRVNCVCCGHMNTEINIKRSKSMPDREELLQKAHPLGIGAPKDAANAIAFLLSDKSKWITGTELVVDGGFLA